MTTLTPFSMLAALGLILCSCAASSPSAPSSSGPSDGVLSAHVSYESVGRRVWQNECAGTVQGLVSWNSGEAFPSLGIGHFIWYPAGVQGPFAESFPALIAYAQSQGVALPPSMKGHAPWPNRQSFLSDRSGRTDEMRSWLAAHIDLQSRFLVLRSRQSLKKMVDASACKADVSARIGALLKTTQGNYCLIDYVNFKGEGLKPTERYNKQGWGLLQVLEEMRGRPQGSAATAEFARAAAFVLTRRVNNAPAERGEKRWLAGWLNRCKTYR